MPVFLKKKSKPGQAARYPFLSPLAGRKKSVLCASCGSTFGRTISAMCRKKHNPDDGAPFLATEYPACKGFFKAIEEKGKESAHNSLKRLYLPSFLRNL
jgi:hypothetical protein